MPVSYTHLDVYKRQVLSIFLYQWYKLKKNMQLMVTRYNLEQSEHELAELKVRQQELELKSVQSALYNLSLIHISCRTEYEHP